MKNSESILHNTHRGTASKVRALRRTGCCLAVLLASQEAYGAALTWKNTAGVTDFNSSVSYTSGTFNASAVPTFTGTEVSQPNVTASASIAGINLPGTGYDITSTGGFTLTLAGSGTTATGGESSASNSSAIASANATGTNTVDVAVVLGSSTGTSVIFQAAGGTLVVNGTISGTPILELNGGNPGGTIKLTGTNSYAGNTLITGGTTVSVTNIGNAGSNGNLGAGSTISFGAASNTGTLLYTGTGETTNRTINLAGTTGGATIDQSGTSGLLKFTGINTATGAGTNNYKILTLQGSSGGTGEISGALVDNSATALTGVTKAGTGTWTLSGANTYSYTTKIADGTLLLSSTGSINGSTSVQVTGTSTLTLNNAAALADTGALSLVSGTTLNLNAAGGTSETIGNLILDGTTEPAGTYTVSQLTAFDPGITFTSSFGETLTITAVPEPATILGGALLVGAMGWSIGRRWASLRG